MIFTNYPIYKIANIFPPVFSNHFTRGHPYLDSGSSHESVFLGQTKHRLIILRFLADNNSFRISPDVLREVTPMPENECSKLNLILFSGDFDKAMAAFTLANGAAGNGMEVSVFFTFWGINLLRRRRIYGKNPLENLFKMMMPLGPDRLGLSKLNCAGLGPRLMRKLIGQKKSQTVQDLFRMAQERKVRFIACEASLKLLGIGRAELIDYDRLEIAGVDSFLSNACQAKVSMFI
jgi:peroxiredoxin family protein